LLIPIKILPTLFVKNAHDFLIFCSPRSCSAGVGPARIH
jgi:hypothetical protein